MKKIYIIIPVIIILIIVFGIILTSSKQKEITEQEETIKQVETAIIGSEEIKAFLKTVGEVKPMSEVTAVSLAKGTVKNIYFKLGDYVRVNDILIELKNENTKESLSLAETGLKTANDNLNNAKILQTQTQKDLKNTVIISSSGYLNTIHDLLDDINYIIKAEGNQQIPGISSTIASQNSQSLINAKESYFKAKISYDNISLDTDNILLSLIEIVNTLQETRQALEDTITVLENTTPNSNFSETTLEAQKTLFSQKRLTLSATQTQAETQKQSLANLDLFNKRELDALENALSYAQNQLNLAKIAFNNLSISSPIEGRVAEKYIEIGQEINPNQNIAKVSQTNSVKIEISLTKEDITTAKIGKTVNIDDTTGIIISISPTADSFTRKIKVEIATRSNLVPGTFVDVEIPLEQNNTSIFIPLKALNISQNENYVFVKQNDKALKRIVSVGKTQGSFVEITQGLTLGEELIIEGNKELQNGEQINAK